MQQSWRVTGGNKCEMCNRSLEEASFEPTVVVEYESRDYECDPPQIPTLREMVAWKNWDEWRFEDDISGQDNYPWNLAHKTLTNVICDGWPHEVEDLPVPVVNALLRKYRDILLELSFEPIN